jgi:mitochondrial fission 1 protein
MGETKQAQKGAKDALDRKLALSSPSRTLLEELAVSCAKEPSQDATFQYAFALSKSTLPSELRYSIQILDGLVKQGYEHQVDCIYGAATALYLLGDFSQSRVRCPVVLMKVLTFSPLNR